MTQHARRGGVRLIHPTARSTQLKMTVPGGIVPGQPYEKTYPVIVNGEGEAFVSHEMRDRLDMLESFGYSMGLDYVNFVPDPPKLIIGGATVTMSQKEIINQAAYDVAPAEVAVEIRS